MGCKVGQFIWDDIFIENGIQKDCTFKFSPELRHQGETLKTYFTETESGKYKPRTVFFDMDTDALEFVKSRGQTQFDDSSFLLGQQKVQELYSSGFYSNGPQYIEAVKEKIRKEVEQCENFNGFMMYSSINRGCGGGFSSLLSQVLTDDYPSAKKIGIHLYPNVVKSSNPLEFLNTVLAHDK